MAQSGFSDREMASHFRGHTYVADNVADKNISNIPVNVADMLEMLLIRAECCRYALNVANAPRMLLIRFECS